MNGFRSAALLLLKQASITLGVILGLATCFACTSSASSDQMLTTVQIGNSRIDVTLEAGDLSVSHDDVIEWVRNAAESVAAYYQRYPMPHVVLHIIPADGRGVFGGRTFGDENGGSIRIHLGKQTIAAGLRADWMLTHEMVHLTFPSVPDKNHWIEEGIATYVEPIARVRAKKFDANQMWYEVVRDMHQGLPQSGDQGLDHTHTWGRTYWGGAMFCLLADVEIRKQTNNQKGLDDALRGILFAGGDMRQDWPLEAALDAGDRATGTKVLTTLYGKMKKDPYPVDLPALWQQLGIAQDGDTVRFNDTAPLAAIREGITYGTPTDSPKTALAPYSRTVVVGRRADAGPGA
jgi:hypothetical protein